MWIYTQQLSIRVLLVFPFSIFFWLSASSQKINQVVPLTIKGHLVNTKEKTVVFKYRTANYQIQRDTVDIDSQGNFYYTQQNLKYPQRINVQQGDFEVLDLFIAPGYNLIIAGDATDIATFRKTVKVSGIGAESNRYKTVRDSLAIARNDTINPSRFNQKQFLAYINQSFKFQEYAAHLVFDKKVHPVKYRKEFKSMVLAENEIRKLYWLVKYIRQFDLSYTESISTIEQNLSQNFYKSIFNDSHLLSDHYDFVMKGNYITYLTHLEKKKDTAAAVSKFDIVNKFYKGRVKDKMLSEMMVEDITYVSSYEKLVKNESKYETYLANISDTMYVNNVLSSLLQKKSELISVQVGKPAPSFTLMGSDGKHHNLKDFIGKVVYIDLWGSWCGPCRQQTPYLKKLTEQFSKNDSIVFISIAIADKEENWLAAIKSDNMNWLQLIDDDDKILKNYFAHSVPRFVLIDKAGTLITFDAPWPGSKEIEGVLRQQLLN